MTTTTQPDRARPGRITLPAEDVAEIAELLERCDGLVRHPDPAVRAAVAGYLHLPADGLEYNLLIDSLAFTAAWLRGRLAGLGAEPARTSGGV